MKASVLSAGLLGGLFWSFSAFAAGSDPAEFWPQWRGPRGTGEAPLADPPVTWSETKNIRWKTRVPGSGTATPIVWGDRVFVLTAIPTGKKTARTIVKTTMAQPTAPGGGQKGGPPRAEAPSEPFQFVVICYDRRTGKPLWQKIAREEVPHEGHHENHGFASASPVTDGKNLYAYFGSRGLHCYDFEGNLKWSKDFGKMETKNSFGEGASPALFGDKIIIVWDHEGPDFITALDKQTGKELWRTPRDERTGWSTPLVVQHAGKQQVVVNATEKVRSYDLETGKELWSCAGQTANAIPSPVADADTVYVMSGFRGTALFAFALGRTGELAGTDAIRWTHPKSTPYVPSPLLVDNLLYFLANNDAKLTCLDSKTGSPNYEAERLEGVFSVYASPVAAKDRLYVLGREGACAVLKKGPKLEILATNKLDEKTDASPALAGKDIFIRGRQNLYCITSM